MSDHPREVQWYLANADVRGPDDCWEWKRGRVGKGYGAYYPNGKGSQRYAHIVAVEKDGREVPDGLVVMHTCDNPPCVNPAHLVVDTQRENLLDMQRKGRKVQVRREGHPRAKLTEEQVVEIRKRYPTRAVSVRVMAREYGISHVQLMRVAKGRAWA